MTMRPTWFMPVLAAAGLMMVAGGPAVSANAAGTVAGSSAAMAISSHQITGSEVAVSCMSATRCEAVGGGAHGGQVVSLYNGKQAGVTTVGKSPLQAVSCPGKAGCWAEGPVGGPRRTIAGVQLVKVGSTGKVISVIKVAEPTGYVFNRIACVSMTSCEVVGEDTNINGYGNYAFYFAAWNGRTLRLHAIGQLYQSSTLDGLSCWRTYCEAVGWQQLGSAGGDAYAWSIANDKPGAFLTRGLKTTFNAVSCISATTCWVIGYSHGSGVVLTLKDGVLGANMPDPYVISGLECQHATCQAVSGDAIVTITNGIVTGKAKTDTATTGFSAITNRGAGFAAIGGAHKSGETEVVTG